jgi:glycosyltransferase involved in cell wall biosynthesis
MNILKDLVSVITPCYNGEGKLNLFLDSILNQTYDNIEFIIINDGSTDNTENIILK